MLFTARWGRRREGRVTCAREPGCFVAASGGARSAVAHGGGSLKAELGAESRTEAAPLCRRPPRLLLDRPRNEPHYPPTRFALPNMYMVTPPYTVIADRNIGMRTCVGVWALRRPAMSSDGRKKIGNQLMARRIEFCGDMVRRGGASLLIGGQPPARGPGATSRRAPYSFQNWRRLGHEPLQGKKAHGKDDVAQRRSLPTLNKLSLRGIIPKRA